MLSGGRGRRPAGGSWSRGCCARCRAGPSRAGGTPWCSPPAGCWPGTAGAGAPAAVGAPAGRRAIVGAGAGAFGAPPTVGGPTLGAGGAEPRPVGIGGLVAAGTTGAFGGAGGGAEAFRVTRTVSFFSGMEEVCFEAGIEEVPRGAGIDEVAFGGGISFSLIGGAFFGIARLEETTSRPRTCQTSISRPVGDFFRAFPGRKRHTARRCLTPPGSDVEWQP